jgi:hypothetical protein
MRIAFASGVAPGKQASILRELANEGRIDSNMRKRLPHIGNLMKMNGRAEDRCLDANSHSI